MAMPNQYELMKQEITFYADLFNKMADQCFKKCIPRYTDSELNTGEKVCVDRCVGKYLDATNKIGEVLQKSQAELPAQGG
mmetsp:Transcript_11397/g.16455  ORF Transcript_11397/g.16455 Transcript_11397/m.16455 type:complete len:80 (-) Transcript_11397:64-303(-)